MMMIIIIIIIIVIIMSEILERYSMSNMLNCAERVQIQKYRKHAYKPPKTACVQSCSNIELSSKDGYKKEKRMYP